jgi:hypothetical protein
MRLRVGREVAILSVALSLAGAASLPAFAQTGPKYGALAVDRSNGFFYGIGVDYDTAAGAEQRAIEEGRKRGGDVAVVLLWSGPGCGAYRSMALDGQGDAYGWGVAGNQIEAESIAFREAQKRSNGKATPNRAWCFI